MAEKKGFDLASVLGEMAEQAAAQDRMQIVYIPYERIIPDKNNGYSMDGINELAGNIEMVGLQQPLVVSPEGAEAYRLISGHRRHAAIGLIIKDGSALFADGVPCIIASAESESDTEVAGLLGELKLILANADNRSKTSADQNREAEGLERIVARLDALGYHFPGRRRAWVAKLSGMSATKLARLKVIRENLDPRLKKKYYDTGKLNETVAYTLAQLPQDLQNEIVAWNVNLRKSEEDGISYLYADDIRNYTQYKKRIDALACPEAKGEGCTNAGPMIDQILVKSRWSSCHCRSLSGKHCCSNCPDIATCKNVCDRMKDRAAAKRAEIRAMNKANRQAIEESERPDREAVRNIWLRFGNALSRANLEEADIKKTRKIYQLPEDEIIALECGDHKKVRANMVLPFSNSTYLNEIRKFTDLADVLGCSVDYLFLRTDVPEIAKALPAAPAAQEPKTVDLRGLKFLDAEPPGVLDGRQCWCWFMDREDSRDLYFMARWHAETKSWFTGNRYSELGRVDAVCLGWWPLPSDYDFDLGSMLAPEVSDQAAEAPDEDGDIFVNHTWRSLTDPPLNMPGWYAVKVRLYGTDVTARKVLWWGDGWFLSDRPDAHLLDESNDVIAWFPLPDDEADADEI